MQEIAKTTNLIDGYEGWVDRVDDSGQHQTSAGRVIQGEIIKFTNEATWESRDGEKLPDDLELIVADLGRVVQKWQDHIPVETIIPEPGQPFPDIDDLNEKTPRSEWTIGPDGKERGPWQKQHLAYLLNPATMDRFTFPTGTVGGGIAIGELRDKVMWMRRYRGAHVYPMVKLSSMFMKTRFGGRQRPHFVIDEWVRLDNGEKVLPGPELAALKHAPVPGQPKSPVEPPSLKEQMGGDAVPDFDDPIDELIKIAGAGR